MLSFYGLTPVFGGFPHHTNADRLVFGALIDNTDHSSPLA
jgi:hypothetical protein